MSADDMHDADCWLGIDLGTQGARAVVIDFAGAVIGAGAERYAGVDHRAGVVHEQDPHAWWAAVLVAVGTALQACAKRRIAAVAIDSTSGTVLVTDADGSADGAALMYDDGRAADLTDTVRHAGQHVWQRTGNRPQGSWGLVKALWLVEHGRVARAQRIVTQAQYIGGRLAGAAVATDTSHALKLGVDLCTGAWPDEVFDALGVRSALASPVVSPGAVIGAVSPAAAQACGLPAGTVIRAGMTDGCAAQIAAGALRPGAWTSALGTTLTVKGASPEPLVDAQGAVYNHRSSEGTWLPGGASSVGAGALSLVGTDPEGTVSAQGAEPLVSTGLGLDALTRRAAAFDPAPGITYPLAATGERFPFVAAAAQAFSTLGPSTAAARFAAVLQGVAYVERYCYERLEQLGGVISEPIVFTGATTANDYWNQLRCDVLGREVLIPQAADAARGMAVLAAAAPGELSATAARMRRTARHYQPDFERGQRHLDNYGHLLTALEERGWLAERSTDGHNAGCPRRRCDEPGPTP